MYLERFGKAKIHGKYSLKVLKRAANREYDSVNYLIKVRN
jgi:hypothetical protein